MQLQQIKMRSIFLNLCFSLDHWQDKPYANALKSENFLIRLKPEGGYDNKSVKYVEINKAINLCLNTYSYVTVSIII